MGKRFKGERCVYCGEGVATAGDHVFARQFFLARDRHNLPQVPACSDCNGSKSRLEHYATTVLPFGAQHATARENLETMVPKRLAKNALLQREIANGMRRVWMEQRGVILPSGAVPLDSDRIERLFEYIARGLLAHHFGAILDPDDEVSVMWLRPEEEKFFEREFFAPYCEGVVRARLGDDTVVYEGIQAGDCSRGSVWRVEMYGGVGLASSETGPESIARSVGLITGPPDIDAGI